MSEQLLFNEGDLDAYLADRLARLQDEIQHAEEKYLLNADPDEWVGYLVAKYRVEPGVLVTDDMEAVDEGEVQVDVSHERGRAIFDPSTPTWIAGRRVVVHIPYEGDPILLRLTARQRNLSPPRATLATGEIKLEFEYPTDTARPDIKGTSQRVAADVERCLGYTRSDVEAWNATLEQLARQTITARRERVLGDRQHLDNLGIPVRRRDDAPNTFAAPGIARRKAPARPAATVSAPQPMEPTLAKDFYEHIIEVIRPWCNALERAPEHYASQQEETLRDSLLPMLNSHYEGQATGETFNASGKTDILVRIQDRNVFTAECKWWHGTKAAGEALDQLFSYTTWRDTKLALIIFVGTKNPSDVVEKVRHLLEERDEFVSWGSTGGAELHCELTWPGDDQVHAQLAVFFVHLPRR